MNLGTLYLADCPVEDQAILKFWRELQAALADKKNPDFARTTANYIEHYFQLRSTLDMNLHVFMERFKEDFDGVAMNRSYSKDQLKHLRLVFNQRASLLFNAEKMMNRPIPGNPEGFTSSTPLAASSTRLPNQSNNARPITGIPCEPITRHSSLGSGLLWFYCVSACYTQA